MIFFFAGNYVISEHNSFSAFNTSKLTILSDRWFKGRAVVECRATDGIEFQDIKYLSITAVTFISCTLNLTRVSVPLFGQNLSITNCVFISSTIFAPHVHIKVNHCIFHHTSAAINCMHEKFFAKMKFKFIVNNSKFFMKTRKPSTTIGTSSALNIKNVQLNMTGCQFIENVATFGGAIYSELSVIQIKNTVFVNNFAEKFGGALCCMYTNLKIIHSLFHNNTAGVRGGALYFHGLHRGNDDDVTEEDFILSDTNFTYNRAGLEGGAAYCKGNVEEDIIHGKISISYSKFNSATNGGFAYLSRCEITKIGFELSYNSAINGGAYYATGSAIAFRGNLNNISSNTARDKGGALFLQGSQIKLFSMGLRILLNFYNNTVTSANGKGGAIFVLDNSCDTTAENQCFVYDYGYSAKKLLAFTENRASQGSVLYGGLLDRCLPPRQFRYRDDFNIIAEFKLISVYEQGLLAISSEAIGVCLCVNDSHVNCTLNEMNFTKMRGESMKLTVAAIDQDGNLVHSIITASYKEALSAQLKQGERSTDITDKCTDLRYHIYTYRQKATLILEPSENPRPLSNITIHVLIIPCSRGFEQQEKTCVCDRRLEKNFNITVCDIDTQSVQRVGAVWLKYDEKYLRIHANCPFDYCRIFEKYISLISPDDQCTHGRSGVLCGACKDNLSIALGGSKCLFCTSNYTAIWLIVVFAIAGLGLVALLLVCNITISSGTLNGLIFYVNVIATSGLTNVHNVSINPILTVFISWLNLDFGVETCFYPGMDTYQKTWLQFAFPLYIWLLVIAIIVASYYSTRAMKLFGRNNIAILATLFLLSYSKLLKTIIATLSFTPVWKGLADNVSDPLVTYKVWSFDGNLEYLKGKHITLFVVGISFLLFPFLPYTLMLLFGQCIRSMSLERRWGFGWTRSIAFISILDAYHAPYKSKHRYWTGLMLLTRCILLLVFATNSTANAILANTFAISLVVVGILVIKTKISNVYKQSFIETLELCFLLNLGVLSATLCYFLGKNNSIETVHNTITASISMSFIMFFCILAYHTYLKIKKSKYYPTLEHLFLRWRWQSQNQAVPSDSNTLNNAGLINQNLPTRSTVELSEKLLESSH